MNTQDIEKLIPELDRTTLTAGQYDFMRDQIGLIRKTLQASLYGTLTGFDGFWRERDDCTLEEKFAAMGTSLRMFFTANTLMVEGLNDLATAANAVLPPDLQIELLTLTPPGVIEFNEDGSLLSWTPTPEPTEE